MLKQLESLRGLLALLGAIATAGVLVYYTAMPVGYIILLAGVVFVLILLGGPVEEAPGPGALVPVKPRNLAEEWHMPAVPRLMSREQFDFYCDRWNNETQHIQLPGARKNHDDFKTLVAAGGHIMPWVMDRLLFDDRGPWFLLAEAIAKEPVSVVPYDVPDGLSPLVTAYWLVWGHKKSYLKPKAVSREGCVTIAELYADELDELEQKQKQKQSGTAAEGQRHE